jgi:hypothetical protein
MSSSATTAPPQKLDDLMLAMDVVDTLRHDERLVERELSTSYSDEALIERLREIYKGQGIEVSDSVLEEGVKALREKRFSYQPPPPSLDRSLALIWIDRARFAWIAVGLLALGLGVAAGDYFLVTQPKEMALSKQQKELTELLPKELDNNYANVLRESKVDAANKSAAQMLSDGKFALARGDAPGARKDAADLAALAGELRAEYVLRIVNRPGEASGVWREPQINPQARNNYLIVEAVAPDGRILSRPILNEETGATSTVDKWGVRVSTDVFQRVLAEKRATGIIESNIVGRKRRGYLDIDYVMPAPGGAITKW